MQVLSLNFALAQKENTSFTVDVKTCERGRVNTVRLSRGPRRLRYNGVTVYLRPLKRK